MNKYCVGALTGVLLVAAVAFAQTRAETYLIQWTAPLTNADGSPLLDLAGYHFCLNIDIPIPADLTVADMATKCTAATVAGAGDTSTVAAVDITVQTAGTLYVRGAAHDTSGNVSVFSEEATVQFDFLAPNTISITITKQ